MSQPEVALRSTRGFGYLRALILLLLAAGFAAAALYSVGDSKRPGPLTIEIDVNVDLKSAAVKAIVRNNSTDFLKLRFTGDEYLLGVKDLAFSHNGQTLPARKVRETSEGSGIRTWHIISAPPREVEVNYKLDPPAQFDFFAKGQRLGSITPTLALTGAHLTIVPHAAESLVIHVTFTNGQPIGVASSFSINGWHSVHHWIDQPFAHGPRKSAQVGSWRLYCDATFDEAERQRFVHGFTVLEKEVRANVSKWTANPFDIVIGRRAPDTVLTAGLNAPDFVYIDADRAYARLWGEVLRARTQAAPNPDWFALGLSELIADAVARKIAPDETSVLEGISRTLEQNRQWDYDVLATPLKGFARRQFQMNTRALKSAMILSLADRALRAAGVPQGIWVAAAQWSRGRDPFQALALAGGITFAGRIRGWCADGAFPYGRFPDLPIIRSREPAVNSDARLTFLFAGSGQGHLETCGCTKQSSGGLARRAAYIQEAKRKGLNPIIVDLGNSVTVRHPRNLDPADLAEQVLYLELLELMGTDTLVVGTAEALRGRGFLQEISHSRRRLQLIANGVQPQVSFPSCHFIERGNWRVAIVAFSEWFIDEYESRAFGDAPDPLHLQPQVENLGSILRDIRDADCVVVAGWITPSTMRAILNRYGDSIDMILNDNPSARNGASMEQRSTFGGFVGRTLVLFHTLADQGISNVTVAFRNKRDPVDFQFDVVKLQTGAAEDPQVQKRLAEFYRQAAAREVGLVKPLITRDPAFDGRFVGSQKCVSCHQAASVQHGGTKHADAFSTLVRVGRQFTARCTPCHVVGFAKEFGWRPQEPADHLRNVGCESCHGAGGEHVERPSKMNVRRSPLLETCTSCHDSKHSPSFELEVRQRWKRVQH